MQHLQYESSVQNFEVTTNKNGLALSRHQVKTIQVNIGKLCNQVCKHCHVEAGPKHPDNMDEKTIDRLLALIKRTKSVQTVDVTGGAPELNPYFRKFVKNLRDNGIEVIDRCNLTVFFEKGQEDTAQFLADQQVSIVASLPCYSESNVDKQRGRGVFGKSIRALQKLNRLGYAQKGSKLKLDLVYNPLGPHLPPPQELLEKDYKLRLKKDFDIDFNHLYCITNMPIKRFYEDLKRTKKLDEYMNLLFQNFNIEAASGVMCRDLISISWDGKIYDCDFNQMLEIPVASKKTVWDMESFSEFGESSIVFANHCYGCTAGKGSSCKGNTTATLQN